MRKKRRGEGVSNSEVGMRKWEFGSGKDWKWAFGKLRRGKVGIRKWECGMRKKEVEKAFGSRIGSEIGDNHKFQINPESAIETFAGKLTLKRYDIFRLPFWHSSGILK